MAIRLHESACVRWLAVFRNIVGDPVSGALDLITEATLTSQGRTYSPARPDPAWNGTPHRRLQERASCRPPVGHRPSVLRTTNPQLYAFLEWQTSGDWPESAHLLPFSGAPVDVDVDASACERLAAEAVELLQDFNDAVPGDQPAAPSAQACGYCPFPPNCRAFWSECGASWQQDILAVAGTVTSVFVTASGDVTLRIRAEAGNCAEPEALLWNISVGDHPAIASATEGSFVAAVNLRTDPDRSVFTLPEWGRLALSPPDAPRPFLERHTTAVRDNAAP